MTAEQIWAAARPFVKALLILAAGHFLVAWLLKGLNKAFARTRLDPSLCRFLRKALNILAHVLLILSALTAVGVSTTGLIAAFSAAGVAVAVALKDSLSNVAGGILLLVSPRFSTGDYIAVGENEGFVLAVDLLHTTLRTFDHRQISIPNGVLINSPITDYSREKGRRLELVFPISYDADVSAAKQAALETVSRHPKALADPETPFARVKSYGDSAVNLAVRVWCRNEDYWPLYFDLTEQIREALNDRGVAIPYNQVDVHIKTDA